MAELYFNEKKPNYGDDNIFTPNVDPFAKQEKSILLLKNKKQTI